MISPPDIVSDYNFHWRICMVGRKKEISELNRLYNKQSAELVAIYGRSRVGKTYLVDETFG